MTSQSTPVKIDRETHELLSHAATALHMTQKDLLTAAVHLYLQTYRQEVNASLRRAMQKIDGTQASRVALLTGISRERLEELGGVREF